MIDHYDSSNDDLMLRVTGNDDPVDGIRWCYINADIHFYSNTAGRIYVVLPEDQPQD